MPRHNIDLAKYTTLKLGGPARAFQVANSSDDIVAAVEAADAAGDNVLILAGGSNVVIGDDGFDGTVVLLRNTGIEADYHEDGVDVTVQAGHVWDDLVAEAVEQKWSGIECLSGIPGSAGATPIQNVGAYGQEVSETFVRAKVWDRQQSELTVFEAADCGLSYRNSVFKRNTRYVVLDCTFRLRRSAESAPIRYAETARRLGVDVGGRVPLNVARDTVVALRRGKGMVLDPADADTFSAGSFFMNPVISEADHRMLADTCGETPPNWPAEGGVKVSAAWLIGKAGFERGFGRDGVSLSTKHTLALTNRGTGSTVALLALAREVRDGVEKAFGVTLQPEPVMVEAEL